MARELQRDGRVRFVGFSTHAPTRDIVAAINTGEFDYVNLHWYFVNDLTWPAVLAAERQDMGVFIISPSDKGGILYRPPAKLAALCQPLSPMQFNDLYCLARPQVHTLSIGAARPSDFEEHVAALAHYDSIPETIGPIEARIRAEMARCLGDDWVHRWAQNLPDYDAIPGEVNVQEILRFWNYASSLDMEEWGRSRYNLLGNGGHWMPGQNAGNFDEAALAPVLAGNPFADRIPDVLRQAHAALHGEPKQRQSES